MIKKDDFLKDLIAEIKENDLFYGLLYKACKLHDKQDEINEKQYYFILSILEDHFNEYINYISVVYDITNIIEKRFNGDITKENIIKSLNILLSREFERMV